MCLTTGPQPLPKRVLRKVWSGAISFNFQYLLVSLRSSSSSSHLLSRFSDTYIFPSLACFRRRFLRKMWPVQLAFHCCVIQDVSLLLDFSLFIIHMIGANDSLQLSPMTRLKKLKVFLVYFPKCQVSAEQKTMLQMYHSTSFFPLNFRSNLLVKSLLAECCFCHSNPWFNFTRISCIICYKATKTVQNIPLLCFLSITVCNGNDCLEILITSVFSTFVSTP